MRQRMKRVIFYLVLAIACVCVAVLFTESRTAFVAALAVGLLFGITADLLFLHHLFRVWSDRR